MTGGSIYSTNLNPQALWSDAQRVTSKIDDNDKSLGILVVYASTYNAKRRVLWKNFDWCSK